MEKTPLSMRKHIAIAGETNAGKSTLFNLLLGQEAAIVSKVRGTTTDPVTKAMELIPYGPVALIDTAGLGDDTALGRQRTQKTRQVLTRANLILHAVPAGEQAEPPEAGGTPVLTVYTKADLLSEPERQALLREHPEAALISARDREGLEQLRSRIIQILEKQDREDGSLLGGLLPPGSTVVLVIPIDSAAPKGRLILPQVQVIRDCLDQDMKAYVTKETTLAQALQDLKKVDLVVTDSQAFALVNSLVPREIPLTSFSMLLARQKGNFAQYLRGTERLADLKDGSRVLVLEGCTHNTTHEDIGRVKLPALIQKKTGARCEFTYCTGYQFPDRPEDFDLALSCGMCMINRQEVQNRLAALDAKGVPAVNYGIALAWLNGILERATEIFPEAR